MSEMLWLGAIAGLVWFWRDALHARERASALCRNSCKAQDLQLLDETVALDKVSLGRDRDGRVRIRRHYRFEFTRDGVVRDSGTVVMLGSQLESLDIPESGGRLFEHGEF